MNREKDIDDIKKEKIEEVVQEKVEKKINKKDKEIKV